MANACPKCTYFYVRCKCDEILLEVEINRLKSALRVAETFLRVHKGTVEILKQIKFLRKGKRK